jgi:hypothetical protein
VGSIPDEVIEIFNLPNPSSRTMAPGLTQPITEISTRNLLGGKGRPARKADKPHRYHLVSRLSRNCGSLDVYEFFPSFNHNSLDFDDPPLNFALFITFLTLFLKLLGLQERFPKTSAGSWFQTWMVLFTKEYFPMSVFCFLLLIKFVADRMVVVQLFS